MAYLEASTDAGDTFLSAGRVNWYDASTGGYSVTVRSVNLRGAELQVD
jgi:hypothetical protein